MQVDGGQAAGVHLAHLEVGSTLELVLGRLLQLLLVGELPLLLARLARVRVGASARVGSMGESGDVGGARERARVEVEGTGGGAGSARAGAMEREGVRVGLLATAASFHEKSSTSKSRVAPPGILGGEPLAPYA